jgi:hypothetical protein
VISKRFSGVVVGDFVRLRGGRLNAHLTDRWHRIVTVDRDAITMIDRRGTTRRISFEFSRGVRFHVWEPGDDRNDQA